MGGQILAMVGEKSQMGDPGQRYGEFKPSGSHGYDNAVMIMFMKKNIFIHSFIHSFMSD